MKQNHHSLSYKRKAQPNKTYKDLKQKQKAKIADWMYAETLSFYISRERMPDEMECEEIVKKIFLKIEGMAIWVPYENVLQLYRKRQITYEARVQRDLEKVQGEEKLEIDIKGTKQQAKCVAAKKSKKKKWMIELSKNLRQFKMKVVRIMKRTDNMLDAKQVLGVVEQFTVALDLLGDYTHQRKKRPLISCAL